MRRSTTTHNRLTALLGLVLAAVFAVAVVFPTAHVAYPDAHDDATCALTATVNSGALVLVAVAAVALVLAVVGRLLALQPVRAITDVPLPYSSRAPPE